MLFDHDYVKQINYNYYTADDTNSNTFLFFIRFSFN